MSQLEGTGEAVGQSAVLTELSSPVFKATAGEAVHHVPTSSSVPTGIGLTVVYVGLASCAGKASDTVAGEGVQHVVADAAVTTGVSLTFVDVCLTSLTRGSIWAGARKGVH